MKKIAVALMILALLSGCAYYKAAKQILCNPSQEQVAEAQKALVFIEAALALIKAPVLEEKLYIAKGEFWQVAQGLCIFLDKLEGAIAAVDEAGKIIEGQEKLVFGALKSTMYPRPPSMPALRGAIYGKGN